MNAGAGAGGAMAEVGADGELMSMTSPVGGIASCVAVAAEDCALTCDGGGVPASIQVVAESWDAQNGRGSGEDDEMSSGRCCSASPAATRSAASRAPGCDAEASETCCAAAACGSADADFGPKISGCADMRLCTESFTLGLPLRMMSVRRTGRQAAVGNPPC